MEITQEIKEKAIAYYRLQDKFIPAAAAPELPESKEIEGDILGVEEVSDNYAYAIYISAPRFIYAKEEADTVVALQLNEEEARLVLSAIVGTIATVDFPKYPRLRLSIPDYYRSIELAFIYRGTIRKLSPTEITSKEVAGAAATLINTALLREKYPIER